MPYDTVFYDTAVDRYCEKEFKRAEKLVHKGQYYLIEMAVKEPRYAKYVQRYCPPGLTYCYIPESIVGYQGFNPLRCFILGMDSCTQAKFGTEDKNKIIARADSDFLTTITGDTIDEQYCNPKAHYSAYAWFGDNGEIYNVACDSSLYSQFKTLAGKIAEPQMFITLCIEPDGTISKYRLTKFFSAGQNYYCDTLNHSTVYDGCGQAFYALALNGIQKYGGTWKAGEVNGKPVRTYHQVEIHFIAPYSARAKQN